MTATPGHVIVRTHTRPDPEAVATLAKVGVATAHEAMGRRGLTHPVLRPIYPGARIAGRAVTVLSQPGDNLMIHACIEQMRTRRRSRGHYHLPVDRRETGPNTSRERGSERVDVLVANHSGAHIEADHRRLADQLAKISATHLPIADAIHFRRPQSSGAGFLNEFLSRRPELRGTARYGMAGSRREGP